MHICYCEAVGRGCRSNLIMFTSPRILRLKKALNYAARVSTHLAWVDMTSRLFFIVVLLGLWWRPSSTHSTKKLVDTGEKEYTVPMESSTFNVISWEISLQERFQRLWCTKNSGIQGKYHGYFYERWICACICICEYEYQIVHVFSSTVDKAIDYAQAVTRGKIIFHMKCWL